MPKVRGSYRECQVAAAQERLRGATPRLRSGAVAERSYPMLTLTSRGRGLLRGFLELRRPWGFSPEARRGSQGASRAAPGKSGLPTSSEEERVVTLE